ncbi:hypothetical protein Pan153_63390 [Gimesia panareensis]|uniref:Uncharacterized protein n=1 Tax=Gimesia panareensis TaxID=2527978 RepID=A0A518FZ51_9PLAN|nr:hypothetical protein [Gimesia panareensis]QDV21649.1 hypothetical protein Pan153_63390 [Gimesia panareensis]
MKSKERKTTIGDLEGAFSLSCVLFVLFFHRIYQTDPWFIVAVFSLGAGLGVGGFRYGSRSGQIVGGITLGILLTLLLLLIVVRVKEFIL